MPFLQVRVILSDYQGVYHENYVQLNKLMAAFNFTPHRRDVQPVGELTYFGHVFFVEPSRLRDELTYLIRETIDEYPIVVVEETSHSRSLERSMRAVPSFVQ